MPTYLGLFTMSSTFCLGNSALVIQAFLHSLSVGWSQINFFYKGPESKLGFVGYIISTPTTLLF